MQMAGTISIKATRIIGTRSRGRAATRTRTLFNGVRADAHPALIMRAMSALFPILEHVPISYQVHGVRYELLRMETRTVNGVRVRRAAFKDERVVRHSFTRQMRRASRARRRAAVRAARLEATRRRAVMSALIARAYAAKIAHVVARAVLAAAAARDPMRVLAPKYPSAPTASPLASPPYG